MPDITASRRTILAVVCGLGAATVASALAIGAAPGACRPDPIHRAIAAHLAATSAVDTRHAAMLADHELTDAQSVGMRAALKAEIDAAYTMVEVAPTTMAGLAAFSDYLAEPRQRQIAMCIGEPIALGDCSGMSWGLEGSVDRLLARHAAQLG